MKTIREEARDIPVRAEVDVLVCGGGPSGIMAAQAAARDKNLKVMLVDQRSYMGGNLTIGLPILAFLGPKGNQVIAGGAQKLIDRLKERNGASDHKACKLHQSLTIIDSEEVKTIAWEIMEESGVDVLLYTFISDAIMEGNEIKGVIIESKAGREAILAKNIIDCTGDGDVAFRAGVECNKGDENGGMQPPTLMYCMRGVNIQKLRDAIVNEPEKFDMDRMPKEQFIEGKFITVGLRGRINEAKEHSIDVPVARTILITGLNDDEIWVNMTRITGTDSTKPESYTRAEHKAVEQLKHVTRYLKEYVPGFEDAWVSHRAPFVGIRESRVIVGKYVMTANDMINQAPFEDKICRGGYPVDIHHSTGDDCTMVFCEDAYDIPYRVLVPEKVENLLVAGRCSSMDHEAMAGTRVMSTCMALGEAAGNAARIALEDGVKVSEVDVKKVQDAIVENGGILC
ncbi:MAG: FAD-dependent oxidoreductase [Coriobacteriia bacterium]|nr:FAD-dependent oxidoreductase [Coriobacteriia bacterium]